MTKSHPSSRRRRPSRRLLWVQLGVPDPDQAYADSNLPVAAGYVLGWCRERALLPGITPGILDPALSSGAGDAALLAAVLDQRPDILCLSCAMWNVERSFRLAREVKARQPAIRVIAGGPEIQSDTNWLGVVGIDAFVTGEGETGLPLALAALDRGDPRPVRIAAPPLAELNAVRDPYSAGILRPGPSGNCLLEVTRGCPYRCHYCFYSKSVHRVRRHPDTALQGFFRWAEAAGVRDVYLLDPTFNVPAQLAGRLSVLEKWNRAGIPLHAETRLEGIDAGLATGFARSGFCSVEAGLQSIHRAVCAGVGRRLDRAAFQRGAAALEEARVRVEAGVILGLPGDSLPGFVRTLHWLARHGLGEEAAVFLLSLLPGTALRDRARAEGWEFQDGPPYFLRAGGGWEEARLLQGIYETEDILGRSHYVEIAPYPGEPAGTSFLSRLDLDAADPAAPGKLEALASRLAWAVTLDVRVKRWREDLPVLTAAGGAYRRHCPFGLIRLVLHGPEPPSASAVGEILAAFRGPDHYWTRVQRFRDDAVREFSVRLYLRAPRGGWRRWLAEAPGELDLVFELPDEPAEFDLLAEAVYAHPRPGRAYLAGGAGLSGEYRRRVLEEVELNRTFARWHPDN